MNEYQVWISSDGDRLYLGEVSGDYWLDAERYLVSRLRAGLWKAWYSDMRDGATFKLTVQGLGSACSERACLRLTLSTEPGGRISCLELRERVAC